METCPFHQLPDPYRCLRCGQGGDGGGGGGALCNPYELRCVWRTTRRTSARAQEICEGGGKLELAAAATAAAVLHVALLELLADTADMTMIRCGSFATHGASGSPLLLEGLIPVCRAQVSNTGPEEWKGGEGEMEAPHPAQWGHLAEGEALTDGDEREA